MDDPTCCGETMAINEYDKNADAYLYICTEDRAHTRWVTDDDEVWK